MKGILLCGGTGSRLYPLTLVTNKHLLPVWDKPMCYYSLNTLVQSGIDDIMVITGKEHCGAFIELLGNEFNGATLTYRVQEKPIGIADAVNCAKRFVGKDNFVTILGDNIFEQKFDFSDFREGARVYLKRIPGANKFGVARLKAYGNKNKIIEIIEKPKFEDTDNELIDKNGWGFAVTGLYLYDNRIFDIIRCLKPSWRGELEITDVNNTYIKEEKMDYDIISGFWSDAGTFSSLFKAGEYIRNSIMK